MARYSTLTSDEEISLGLSIREARREIWRELLNLATILDAMPEALTSNDLEIPSALMELTELSVKNTTSKSAARQAELAEMVADQMSKIDLDEIVMQKMLLLLANGVALAKTKKRLTKAQTQAVAAFRAVQASLHNLRAYKHHFINANLRLVIAVARRYNNGPMNLIDLIQEGNIGLMKAVDRFDPDRGYRFSTYAAWWIRHAVSRASADKGRTVRLPVHFIESYQQLNKIKKELHRNLDRVPSSEELATAMGISRKKVDRIEGYLKEGTLSLDRKVNSDDSRSFMELLEDPTTENGIGSDVIREREILLSSAAIVEVLTPMERDVIKKRYGIGAEDCCTLKEIGALYSLSRERIRQIQENALKKMRKYFAENGML